MAMADIAKGFGAAESTPFAKAKAIRNALGT
jgi:hypothetical protein